MKTKPLKVKMVMTQRWTKKTGKRKPGRKESEIVQKKKERRKVGRKKTLKPQISMNFYRVRTYSKKRQPHGRAAARQSEPSGGRVGQLMTAGGQGSNVSVQSVQSDDNFG